MEALIAHEDSLCPGCGQPRDRAWDPRTEGDWEAHEHYCQPCIARNGEQGKGETKPGRYVTVQAAADQPQDSRSDSSAR